MKIKTQYTNMYKMQHKQRYKIMNQTPILHFKELDTEGKTRSMLAEIKEGLLYNTKRL